MQFSSSGFGIVYATKVTANMSDPDRALSHCMSSSQCIVTQFRSVHAIFAVTVWVAPQDEQRIMKAVPGRLYIVEGCVSTNATYGNSFRPLTLYRLEASAAGGTLLIVCARIVFVKRINSLIRALINRCGVLMATTNCCPASTSCQAIVQLACVPKPPSGAGRAADGGMRSNFAAVLVTLAEEAKVTDGKGAQPATRVEEPVRRSIGASADQRPANTAASIAQDPAAAPVSQRLAALVRMAAGSSRVTAAAYDMAGRCGLDAAACQPVAVVLCALLAFKLLGLLCRSELVTALTVVFAAFLYFAEQPQQKPAEVSCASSNLRGRC